MASQSAINSSEISCNEPYEKIPRNFKWTIENEMSLLKNMKTLKPVGINKHLNMLIIRENISKDLKLNMTTKCLWKFVNSKWDIPRADKFERLTFIQDKNRTFDLPEEYDLLVAKLSKKLEKEGLNDQNNKKKLIGSSKTRSKSNSVSSVDSKDSFNEVVPKCTDSTSVIKTGKVRPDEVFSSRRSLRSNDKLEEFVDNALNRKKLLQVHNLIEKNSKMKDSKHLNTNKFNQSNDSNKNKKMSNARSLNRKSRNVSESSFKSDNIKKLRSSRSTTTNLNISDGSSRSVTPETFRGKPKKLNQSNNSIKNKKMSNARSLKRKSRNVSESSFSSDNIKKLRSSRITRPDLNISDGSSRSVTPETLRGKSKKLNQSYDSNKNKNMSNARSLKRKSQNATTGLNISDGSSRSVTPETLRGKSNRSVKPELINRNSNLRSGDKDQKMKSLVENPSNNGGQSLSEFKIERMNLEKSEKQRTKLTPSKNETASKAKDKGIGRLTADYLVTQQYFELQSLGRRSLNKTSTLKRT